MATVTFSDCNNIRPADIAIVGAGISGLYCAWRLVQQDPTRTIAIVERLNRTGGRLDSDIVEIKPDQNVREEQGGMRFNYGMDELMVLVNALGLCEQIVPFPMGSENQANRFFLRGRSFTVAEAEAGGNTIWGELYDLDQAEKGLSPTDIIMNAYRNILYVNDSLPKEVMTPDDWTQFREDFVWHDKPMNQWQLWGLLRDMGHSEECIQMLTETIGFAGPFKSLANAGDAFQILADFPKDPSYYTFQRGFSTLPNAIREDLEKNYSDRVQIYLSTNVDSILQDDECFNLRLTEAPEQQNSNPFIPEGQPKSLQARQLILAVAAKGMEKLFITSPALHRHSEAKALWDSIHTAVGMKLMKINLYFDTPWWHDGQTGRLPIQFGPNFSSLPVNAVYPFYALPEGSQPAGQATDNSGIRDNAAAALTIYCDFNNTSFWRGLQNIGPMFISERQEQENARRPQALYAASQAVVQEARKQLATLFDTTWVPEPVLTSYRLWNGEDDFEFAYHQWGLNVVDSQVRDYLAAPFENVYICNEAFSDMQGWVNGSLRSANLLLKHFGLEPMSSASCSKPSSDLPEGMAARSTKLRRRVSGLWGG